VISAERERCGNYEEMHRIDNSPKNADPQKGGSPVAPEN
jgi:hypothetical protein